MLPLSSVYRSIPVHNTPHVTEYSNVKEMVEGSLVFIEKKQHKVIIKKLCNKTINNEVKYHFCILIDRQLFLFLIWIDTLKQQETI